QQRARQRGGVERRHVAAADALAQELLDESERSIVLGASHRVERLDRPELAQEEVRLAAVLEGDEMRVEGAAQIGERVAARRDAAERLFLQARAEVVVQVAGDIRLVGEVVVEGALSQPGARGDVVDRRGGVAALAEQRQRGGEDAVLAVARLRLAAGHSSALTYFWSKIYTLRMQ